jgi:hypothetical protein
MDKQKNRVFVAITLGIPVRQISTGAISECD